MSFMLAINLIFLVGIITFVVMYSIKESSKKKLREELIEVTTVKDEFGNTIVIDCLELHFQDRNKINTSFKRIVKNKPNFDWRSKNFELFEDEFGNPIILNLSYLVGSRVIKHYLREDVIDDKKLTLFKSTKIGIFIDSYDIQYSNLLKIDSKLVDDLNSCLSYRINNINHYYDVWVPNLVEVR